jgi:hypothetical protein
MQGLHKMLQALPLALPLAMGHSAATTVTKQLRETLSAKDAIRLDKLYKMVSKDDSTTECLDAVLEPLYEGME